MKVTAKVDYAVRAVAELAVAEGDLVKADVIAAAQDIPRHFLDNILTELRRAGIVSTHRGAEGGSRLARPANEITIADIMRAMEGPLAAVRDAARAARLRGAGRALARRLGGAAGCVTRRARTCHCCRSRGGQAAACGRQAARRSGSLEAALAR